MKSKPLILALGIIVAAIICGTQYVKASRKTDMVEIEHYNTMQKRNIRPVYKILLGKRAENKSKPVI